MGIKIKINVSKLLKEHFFKGKSGTYVDLTLWENDEPDQYGNDYVVKQDCGKDSGVKPPIVGNGKNFGAPKKKDTPQKKTPPKDPDLDGEEDDIPF